MPKIAIAHRVIESNARQHADDRRRPDFHMLAEEMLELSLALRGKHEHPAWLELIQIGGIVTNWLADIMIEQGDAEIIEYLRRDIEMPPRNDIEDLETMIVEIGNPPMIVGVLFSCPNEQRKEFAQAYADEILREAQAKGMNTNHPNFFLLSISLEACGGRGTYRTVNDIPLVDVPCPCGDPNHWLIKWRDEHP